MFKIEEVKFIYIGERKFYNLDELYSKYSSELSMYTQQAESVLSYTNIPDKYKIYVYYNHILGFRSEGFLIDQGYVRLSRLYAKSKRLYANDYKFRNGSVPFVHKYKTFIPNHERKNSRKELRNNDYAFEMEKEYNLKLVRGKRNNKIEELLKSYNWENHLDERSWKRSKKRKQYL